MAITTALYSPNLQTIALLLLVTGGSINVQADSTNDIGSSIDKVYHPYVQPLEREFEARTLYQSDSDPARDGFWKQSLSYGASIGESVFLEAYLIGEKRPDGSLEIEGYELEAKIQLTEQGEYWADWGLLVELERERDLGITEAALGIIAEKEWRRWVGTVNLIGAYESGGSINNEFEVALNGQLRYRWQEKLEPALEFYSSEFTRGIGPALLGLQRLGGKSQLKWELGLIFGTGKRTPDQTLRFSLEYEF